jgi:hypothetical protein
MEGPTVSSSQWRASDIPAPWDSTSDLSGLYTCLACQIGFHTAELQRQHYRTDWYGIVE